MNDNVKTVLLWLFAFSLIFLLVNIFMHAETKITDITFKQFIEQGEKGNIAKVEKKGQNVKGEFISPFVKNNVKYQKFVTVVPADYPDIINEILKWRNLEDFKVIEDKESTFMTVLISWAPLVVLIVIWIMFMKQMQGGGAKALSFGKSKARLVDNKKITFKDVAGVEEAKEELMEVVEFLKNPKKFQRLGGKIPKGVLLMGPPGTGKTLLAKAVAGEAGVPFFSISGSEFVEMFVGVGASRVRDLFEQGKKNAPCIIFIDELDAVGRHRGAGLGGGHDEREQTLNQLLVEMDGFETETGVILIAATNRPDVLDPALLRPGRFDRRIVVDRPDVKGREAILKIHTRNIPIGEDVDLKVIARSTPGFAGAELANLVNEAALLAARKDKELVEMEDFEEAKDKVIMGLARKSMVLSDEEKKNTAYHEAGHAIVAALLPGADPIHKVTIIPRGRALGVTVQLPEDDRYTYTKDYLENRIAILMGGRIAEEVYMGHITTGAGNDIEVATDLARKMVCKWGMSGLGPINLGVEEQEIFLGKDLVKHQNYSNDTAKLIDAEIKNIIMSNYNKAKDLLKKYEKEFLELANKLFEKEVLSAEEVYAIVRGESTGGLSAEPQES